MRRLLASQWIDIISKSRRSSFRDIQRVISPPRPHPSTLHDTRKAGTKADGTRASTPVWLRTTAERLDGNDILRGGSGTDVYNGGNGFDIVEFLDDAIAWTVNLATNIATQGATTETLSGVEGAYGTAAADTFTGNASANLFRGNGGNDVINAGDGDDIIEVDLDGGFDSVAGGLGNDTIRALQDYVVIGLTALSGVETITANGFANVELSGSSSADSLDFSSAVLLGIDRIDGSGGNDTITGTALADIIVGGSGDDVLNGGGGNDVFQRGSSSGFDTVNGGDGTDTIVALNNNAVIGLIGLAAVETISSGGFSNVSIGGSWASTRRFQRSIPSRNHRIDAAGAADIITGSVLADTIVGNTDDTLAGGLGDDLFQVRGSGGRAVNGGAGNDTLAATANSTMIGLRSVTAARDDHRRGLHGRLHQRLGQCRHAELRRCHPDRDRPDRWRQRQ